MRRRPLQTHRDSDSRSKDVVSTIYDTAMYYYNSRLALYKKVADSDELRQLLRDRQRTLTVSGRLVDWTNAYNDNPFPEVPNSIYASASLLSDALSELLTKLSFTAVFGEEIARSLMGPTTYLLAMSKLLDDFYPEISEQIAQERAWYQSLTAPEERQTAIEAMRANVLDDTYGLTLMVQGFFDINHYVLGKVQQVGEWGREKLSAMLMDWTSALVGDNFWYLGEGSARQSDLEAIGKPIRNTFAMGSIVTDVMRSSGLPFEAAQQVVAYHFLRGTSYASFLRDSWLADSIKLPEGMRYQDLLDRVEQRVREDQEAQRIQAKLAEKKTFADRLAEAQRQKMTRQGYAEAVEFGGMLAQFGQLVGQKTLVQAGQVFQQGIRIVSCLEKLNGVGQKLASLNLGPISTLASAVMTLIGLFHSSGPTAQQIIIKQLDQIQTGIRHVLENQAILLDAINSSYVNLLNAIREGMDHLAELMHAEFNKVSDELYILSDQLTYYVKEILSELHRAELSIDQGRLTPLRGAITAAMDFKHRHPDSRSPLYESEVRTIMQTLEHWGSETVCDPSFTGDTELEYSTAITDPGIIYRHFHKDTIELRDVLLETGFLSGVFHYLLSKRNVTTVEMKACNMDLWSQIVLAYREIAPYALPFLYDPEGALVQQLFQPADTVRKITELFQQHAFALMSILQTKISYDVGATAGICAEALLKIREDIDKDYRYHLNRQRERLLGFIDAIPEPQALSYDVGYPGRRIRTSMLTLSVAVLQEAAKRYLQAVDRRLGDFPIELRTPLTALMSGPSLSLGAGSQRADALLMPAFPFLDPNASGIPSMIVQAELLGNGNVTATFACSSEEWTSGFLQCETQLRFNTVNGTSFLLGSVDWQGEMEMIHPIREGGFYRAASSVFNSLPFFPWNTDCNPQMAGGNFCVKWSNATRYRIDAFSPDVVALARSNHLKMAERISALNIVGKFSPGGELSYLYDALESKWQLYRAFAMAIGVENELVRRMNAFDIQDMLKAEILATDDYDLGNDAELPPLAPRILARFSPFFDGVVNQTMRAGGEGASAVNATVYKSALLDFIDQITQHSQTLSMMRKVHGEAMRLNPVVDAHFDAVEASFRARVGAPSFRTQEASDHAHESSSWQPAFLGAMAAVWASMALLGAYGCMVQRRAGARQGYQAMGPVAGAALLAHAIPGAQANLLAASWREFSRVLPAERVVTALSLSMPLYQEADNDYYGFWDERVQLHPYTGEPIFTYRVYSNGLEVGSAQFYKHPLWCRSVDGTRHNIMERTGIVNQYDLEAEMGEVSEICAELPPTALEQFGEGVGSGVSHGVIRGAARLVERAAVQQGCSPAVAGRIRAACYYITWFSARTAQYYALDAADSDGMERLQHAAQSAAVDTLSLAALSQVVSVARDTLSSAAHHLRDLGWRRTSGVLGTVGQYAGLSLYACNAQRQGLPFAAGSVVGGYLSETATELVGNTVFVPTR